jgi:hypothetical protein
MAFDLDGCRAMLQLSEDQVRERLDGEGSETRRDLRYEGLEHVTQYYNPRVFPGRVYVRDGRVQMVYVPSGPALKGLTTDQLEKQLGGKATELRSRAGKSSVQTVRPQEGVAYSSEGDEVQFVEVFSPRTLDAYKSDIYRDPGPFKL